MRTVMPACFCAGLVSALWFPEPGITLLWCLSAGIILLLLPRSAFKSLLICLLAGLAVSSAQFYGFRAAAVKETSLARINGCIVSTVRVQSDSVRFVFKPVTKAPNLTPGRILVTWYRNITPPESGTCWQLVLRQKPARGLLNEYGSDYERWLFANRIRAIATVKESPLNHLYSNDLPGPDLLALRIRIFSELQNILKGHDSAPLLGALAVGIRTAIPNESWQVLKRTGTAHLMAISGLHVGLAALFGFWFGRWLPVRINGQSNLVTRGKCLAFLFALAYSALAGFAVPTVRALTMLFLWLVFSCVRARVSFWMTLLATAAIVLVFNPFTAASHGFWLSFGAVVLIVCTMEYSPGKDRSGHIRPNAWHQMVRMQLVLMLCLLPFSVTIAGGVSWVSIPANLFLIPVVSVAVVPVLLISLVLLPVSPEAAGFLLILLAQFTDVLWATLQWASSLSLVFTEIHAAKLHLIAGAALAGASLWLPRSWPARHIYPLLALPLFFVNRTSLPSEFYRVDVLDVGQALAVVIQTRNHTLIYDTGNAWPGGDSGSGTIVPFLKNRGVRTLDTVIVSHGDRDHAGGLRSILEEYPAQHIWQGELVTGAVNGHACMQGVSWLYDGVRFEFLHPGVNDRSEGNEQSCVLLISAPGGRVLLTGDLGGAMERKLLSEITGSVDLVIGAHHGSLSSSDELFVRGMGARYVVFSNGYGNQWGMPRSEVVRRWQKAGTRVFETATSGQLGFISGSEQSFELVYSARSGYPFVWRWKAL